MADRAGQQARETAPGISVPHESAALHVAGEATYVDDIPELAGTRFVALGLSEQAHANIRSIDLEAVRSAPGVVAVITATDIPGRNNCGPIIADDPILVDGLVQYVGQPIFAVVADTQTAARKAARLAQVDYEALPAILDIASGKRQQSWVLPPMRLRRGDADKALAQAQRSMKGEISVGGQEQFYLEGQISYVAPKEDGCFHLWCSTQHPTEMQHVVAHALGLDFNRVVVEMRRMGGGFGGKESQSAIFACIASVAAFRLNCPVKLRLDRDDDMMITGKRHGFDFDYEVGYDNEGLIQAAKIEMAAQAGFSADLTGPVVTRAVCHFDNAYYLGDVAIDAFSVKTNTQSNTAFRGFGGPQGAFAIEYIIDNIARELGKDPQQVRKLNFYDNDFRNTTPYGQLVEDSVIHELVAELEQSSDYYARREAVAAYNRDNPVLRKGLSLTPLKFGISFNVVHFNQAGALVHVYTDGSVLVNHGGTEMGQGLHTKVSQVVALELGIDLAQVRATANDTSKVANTSATAASTGSDLNGKAAQDAARQIRNRLAEFAAGRFGAAPDEVSFEDGVVSCAGGEMPFTELVVEAYENRVQLWSDGFYKTPGLNWDRDKMQGSPFYYFAYGAAVSEVVVDTLTGEFRLLRADILHDAGNSINPAIDIGQVEGAYIQGMGWLTSEELCWDEHGRLTTHAPSTYKIPTIADCPASFNTRLYQNQNVKDTILRSKAVGEPPLLLPFSVFFAIRDAIASLAGNRVNPPLRAPATPEAILDAIDALRAEVA
ncbi:MAG: xanthine dehydrogenase molybdopterin binding subunit [Gammaproteobacteria bacterium]|nr:xanthine dehydrogenase molybdopterin binding subunit [Gammaproteobacteria bacterium]MDH3534392.1 xanthine dehydrogenase molybdopterin binding subunit [Gammaproteobacteria bacterium]